MPRDKKLSHQRVLEAAKKEFLEKGFEGASIRTIANANKIVVLKDDIEISVLIVS